MSKTALITGGTRGIGKAVADIFAKDGYNLILTYSSDENTANNVSSEINKRYGVDVTTIKADITQMDSIELAGNHLKTNNILLDSLILNAGITLRSSFEETKFEDWDKVFFANVHFPVFFIQKNIKYISKGGNIIFTGSLMGIHPHGMSLSYGVTKSATHALVSNLVKFLKPYDIRVNGVAPGFVDTDWQKTKPAEIRKSIESKISLNKFCLPEQVAEVYLMLANNKYFNGEIIKIDGGYSYK